jgi:hypothetical protein
LFDDDNSIGTNMSIAAHRPLVGDIKQCTGQQQATTRMMVDKEAITPILTYRKSRQHREQHQYHHHHNNKNKNNSGDIRSSGLSFTYYTILSLLRGFQTA